MTAYVLFSFSTRYLRFFDCLSHQPLEDIEWFDDEVGALCECADCDVVQDPDRLYLMFTVHDTADFEGDGIGWGEFRAWGDRTRTLPEFWYSDTEWPVNDEETRFFDTEIEMHLYVEAQQGVYVALGRQVARLAVAQ